MKMNNAFDSTDLQDYINKKQLNSGRVFLWGDVNEESCKSVVVKMRYIVFDLKQKNIWLYIHTSGGELDSCCAVIDEIVGLQKMGVNICTIAIGKAYSCGALILAVGSERYATALTSIMMHPVSIELPDDFVGQQRKYADFVSVQYQMLMDLVSKRCGYTNQTTIKAFKKKVQGEVWLGAKDAIDLGIIDNVWDYKWEKVKDNDNS